MAPASLSAQQGPMPVTVSKPVMRKVVETADFTGRFQAWPEVNVTSRVTGYLDTASFVEGGLVKEGDVLFTIDPRSLQAAVDQAKAQAKINQTKLDLASTNLKRAEELKRTGNVTDAVYQSNQQAFLEAQASIDSANAALASAKLDLVTREAQPLPRRASARAPFTKGVRPRDERDRRCAGLEPRSS